MVRRMARRIHRLENPTIAGYPAAIAHGRIRNEVPIAAFLDGQVAALPASMRAKTVSWSTRCRLERLRRGRMVAMSVGDQDMRDLLARETGEQRLDMVGEIGAGVDHCDLTMADDISPGTPEGEGAGIARYNAPDHRCDRLQPAVFEREFATKGDLDSHGRKTTRDFS